MDIRELRLYVHLASTLRFARTAGACNISPSALSRTIQRLEEEVQCTLLQRDKRFVTLTGEGRAFLAYARDALDRYEETLRTLSAGQQEIRGEISLFCSVTAAQSLLERILPPFRRSYPAVTIRIQTGDSADAVDRVLEGHADLSIAARPERLAPPLEFRELARTPLVFIAPRREGDVARLAEEQEKEHHPGPDLPLILADRALSRIYAERWLRARGVRPRIEAEVSGHEAIIAMVQLGLGVGVVPRLVLDQSPLAREVRVLDFRPALPEYQIGLCAQRRRLALPAIRALWETSEPAS
jgi:LysR family transcriptional regulator, positive regulator for ilvC